MATCEATTPAGDDEEWVPDYPALIGAHQQNAVMLASLLKGIRLIGHFTFDDYDKGVGATFELLEEAEAAAQRIADGLDMALVRGRGQ